MPGSKVSEAHALRWHDRQSRLSWSFPIGRWRYRHTRTRCRRSLARSSMS